MTLGGIVFALSVQLHSPVERLVPLKEGESLRVVIHGEAGPAVVILPGLFVPAYGFRRLGPVLARPGRQVAIVEPLGSGGSSRPSEGDYSLTAQADRVAAVMRQLAMERAVVVAHSVGSSIAFRLALRHPGLVAAVVSLEGGIAEGPVTGGFRRAMRLAPVLRLLGARALRRSVAGTLRNRSANPGWVTEEIVDGYMAAGGSDVKAALDAYQGMARSREPERLAPRLADLQCPAWLLLGAAVHEGGIKPPEIESMRSSLPTLRIERVPGSGHFIFEERPDAVAAAVDAALAAASLP